MSYKDKKDTAFISNRSDMLKGKTPNGFYYSIDKRVLKDYRLIEAMGKINSKNEFAQAEALTKIVEFMMRDKKDTFLEFLSDGDGFVDFEKVFKEITAIFKQHSGEIKNS